MHRKSAAPTDSRRVPAPCCAPPSVRAGRFVGHRLASPHTPRADAVAPRAQVTVVGPTVEAVAKAREMLELAEEEIEIPQSAAASLLGNGGNPLRAIEERAGLVHANIWKNAKALKLTGSRAALEKAKLIVELELDYIATYAEESSEVRKLVLQARALGIATPSSLHDGGGPSHAAGFGAFRGLSLIHI